MNAPEVLQDIVEGKNLCPTFLDIEELISKQVGGEKEGTLLSEHDQWVETHLMTCNSCGILYDLLYNRTN